MRPTGKSISVSVRVVRAVRAGGRGEAKLRGSVRAAMIPRKVEAAGPKSLPSRRVVSWRRRCSAGARPVPGARLLGARPLSGRWCSDEKESPRSAR